MPLVQKKNTYHACPVQISSKKSFKSAQTNGAHLRSIFFYPCADQMRMHSCLANLGMGGSHQRQAQQKLFVVLRITRVCLLLDRTKRASLGTEGTVICGLAHMRKNVCAHSRNVYPLCATVWKWVIRQTSSVQFMSLGLLQRAS